MSKEGKGKEKAPPVISNSLFSGKSNVSSAKERVRTLPWIEKYRPRTVDDVAHQEEVVRALKKSIETHNLPHLLFYGPPGTGKTSTILAIARDIYGQELLKERVLELNASDERGINVVRNKVKDFAQVSASHMVIGGKPIPGYKLIILDEADAMTADAQAALRRTMETFSKTTRFCLICNYVSRIIEPLASRCAKFRFKPLENESMLNRIQFICEKEEIQYSEEIGKALTKLSEGDLRKAITFLQSAYRLHGGKDLDSESIINVAGVMPESITQDLMTACQSNSFDQLQTKVSDIISQGYPAIQVISQLHDIVVSSEHFTSMQKSHIAIKLAEADKALSDGADEYLQLMDSLSFLMRQICSTPS
eukprot:TRINITY_DN6791_c0_g1_i2.p1 TRINITY_DN6791_c0_g1~~TRINITY_DN6791_c0_g1_i2.p1  ORF type:complete len:364 (+),score=61.27 TRINITY_DN6791_c0_g1_i2:109-1200(+)